MKKLTNVSPFLLLLFPVFIMMLFAFATSTTATQEDEVVLKTTPTATNSIVKAFLK
ncbi:hypothetical protein [Pedobacter namyangjuensis]|uniref:hypothetical protein n=1 Tax=Pedobacter namyangjuensis TaxID=600626 RepID=UPI0013B3841B|nr:hypothetical protein [Pedobacter namyangjuensis]